MTAYRVVQGSWELRFTIPAGWTSPSLAVKVREDFSLRDGDSLLDVFVVLLSLELSSYRRIFWSWTYCRGRFDDMAVFTLCVKLYLRYDGNSTFKQHNQVSPPSGHWNPETLEP